LLSRLIHSRTVQAPWQNGPCGLRTNSRSDDLFVPLVKWHSANSKPQSHADCDSKLNWEVNYQIVKDQNRGPIVANRVVTREANHHDDPRGGLNSTRRTNTNDDASCRVSYLSGLSRPVNRPDREVSDAACPAWCWTGLPIRGAKIPAARHQSRTTETRATSSILAVG